VSVQKGLLTKISNQIKYLRSGEEGERQNAKLLLLLYTYFLFLEKRCFTLLTSSPFGAFALYINYLSGEKTGELYKWKLTGARAASVLVGQLRQK
jgi:hypothetical protein